MKIYSDLLDQRLYGFGIFTSGLRKPSQYTIDIYFGMTTSLRTNIGRPRLVLVWMKGLGPVEMDAEH